MVPPFSQADASVDPPRVMSRARGVAGLICAAALLVALSIPFLGRPPTQDENGYTGAIQTMARFNRPFFYAKSLEPILPFRAYPTLYVYLQTVGGWLVNGPHHLSMVPNFPLYIYLLAGWVWLLGEGIWVFRSFGLVCGLLSLALFWPLGRRLYQNQGSVREKTVLAAGIFVTLPLTPLAAILIELDTSILTVTTLLFILIFLLGTQEGRLRSAWWFLGIAVGFAIALLTKTSTPLVFFPTVFLYSWGASRRLRPALINSCALLTGAILFLGAWWIAASALEVSFLDPFRVNFGILFSKLSGLANDNSGGEGFFRTLLKRRMVLYFFSPWFLGLAAWSTCRAVVRWARARRLWPADFLLLYGVLGFVGYYLVRPQAFDFPKYTALFAPAFALVITGDLVELGRENGWWAKPVRFWLTLAGFGSLYAALALAFLGEPLLVPRGSFWLYILPFLVVAVVLLAKGGGKGRRASAHLLLLAMAFGTVPFYLGTTILRMGSDRSLPYCIGVSGLEEAMRYFRSVDSGSEFVLAPRSFRRLVPGRFIPPEILAFPLTQEVALDFLRDRKTRWVIFGPCNQEPISVPKARQVVRELYREIHVAGDYRFFRRTGGNPRK